MNPPPLPEKVIFIVDEKNLLPSAPMLFRSLAFLADSVLVLFLSAIAVKLLLPVFCPNGFFVFTEYYRELGSAYEATLTAAANGGTANSTALDSVFNRISQDETLISFFDTIYTVSFLVAVLYFILTEFFMRGQTLGKKIFGLRTVIYGTPFPPLFLQILSRAFWKAFTVVPAGILLTLLAVINANIVAFSRRHRGWHDKLARTDVIDLRALNTQNSSPLPHS
ncbi:MAG: RDD family protein [Opitutales bacterium]|nr:RDD family protein [Opitutales bacterium]